ncbi:PDZ domain-containing protein GIPC3-like [Macrosteles quadrilineatus]|uniref:PDZ domain-containing protein GIPC3-like n=1 Tax=Macrosteles quadrilineatus TaxID=74068 RepID=UPI0023E20467|nr:PDZ domain-containing protein GIPC3-like [Macrosteles quadrilineatus]XP_054289444.1 PDZ domain-containing protein GIPC3-like [Macrosteles quadrilineatus]
MPLFTRKFLKDPNGVHDSPAKPTPTPTVNNNGVKSEREVAMAEPQKQKLVFHCQQAQGSPTGLISGFSNVRELYQKIAECYDFPAEEILFCTLNTHKVDMTKLLGGQIGLDDFIFVHRKGRPKEIELRKTEEALGLTITDNGSGYAFIKRIKEGSVIDGIEYIQVGDHIERINSENLVGKRHFEVAKMLKEIPRDTIFTIRLVEPLKAGFSNIDSRGSARRGKKSGYGTGKETLRLKADGKAQVQKLDSAMQQGIDSINQLLEGFMGINDSELATQIWEHAEGKTNSMDFAEAIDNSDLEEFGFTDEFIIELWGAITDARAGRLKNEVF